MTPRPGYVAGVGSPLTADPAFNEPIGRDAGARTLAHSEVSPVRTGRAW
ncbi:MAG: hypothetical protein QOH74_1540, partial [Gaiellales bacterium]|nr:hypothetical protein [Gaiellales bacterium]